MTTVQAPAPVRRLMTAAAQLLVGEGADHDSDNFNRNVILIVGGEIGPFGAMKLAAFARANRRNVLHLGFGLPENPECPVVTFVHVAGGNVTAYESCILWADDDHSPVHIIRPDAGAAFQMTRSQRIKSRRSPVSGWDDAMPGAQRALRRLHVTAMALEDDQMIDPILGSDAVSVAASVQ